MKDALAVRLLTTVMGWSDEEVARELPELQALADHKYNQYQQFSPGMRFVESLATWLGNFETKDERTTAYRFIRQRLVFISSGEMNHLVAMAYRDHIRPILLRECASRLSVPDYRVAKIAGSGEFRVLCRKSLFLGLSDGAHVDVFRRASGLSNEQVYVDYRLEHDVAKDLGEKLRKDLSSLTGKPVDGNNALFELVFLLNDFSGSSDTLLRKEEGQLTGKLVRAMETIRGLQENDPPLVAENSKVFVILYVATETALRNLKKRLPDLCQGSSPTCESRVVHLLEGGMKVTAESDPEFDAMLHKYYRPTIMDEHLSKGGPDVIRGYASCGLPLVLYHNTPNNSVYLLWASQDGESTWALFPRLERHKETV